MLLSVCLKSFLCYYKTVRQCWFAERGNVLSFFLYIHAVSVTGIGPSRYTNQYFLLLSANLNCSII